MPDIDTPLKWDFFKCRLKSFIQAYSNKAAAKRRRNQKHLQRVRNRILRQPVDEINTEKLSSIESQLDKFFEQSASTLALRSGLKWREQGERSNAYLYRCLQQRQQQQSITVL
ncbi:hypothetical protein G6F56_013368 [Rhizopus delemar]|nr:hypothetical protein G6F56_013368 [Rhizopus delemar]